MCRWHRRRSRTYPPALRGRCRSHASASQRSRGIFIRSALAAAACTAALVLLLAPTRAFTWLEAGTYDTRSTFAARNRPSDPSIVVLDIDNPSFDNLQSALGRWP